MKDTFKPYPKYKPSGVEWLGDIPEHWEIQRGRWLADVNPISPRLRSLSPSEEVSFVPMDAIGIGGGLKLNQSKKLDEVSGGYTEFQNGDIVVAKITPCFENGKSALAQGLLNGCAYGTTELHVLRPREKAHPPFLFRLATSDSVRKLGEGEMYGAGGQKRVPSEFFKDIALPLPPLNEQVEIAALLEEEAAKIDETIKELEESIELLNEEKTSLIYEYVTGKINPETGKPYPKYKPSGVEWLGDIPEHWNLMKIGTLFRDSGECGEAGLSFLSISIHTGASDREFSEDELERKVSRSEDPTKYLRVRPGDLVYNMMRAWQGGVGTIEVDGMVSPAYVVARPVGDVDTAFVEALLRTKAGTSEMNRYSKGITDFRKRLYWEDFKAIHVALPPSCDSDVISASINSVVLRGERLVSEKQSLIETLKEYRTSLIHEAVTGKIDLRRNTA